jgi:hypothetical protein
MKDMLFRGEEDEKAGASRTRSQEKEHEDRHIGVFKATSFSVKLGYLTATLRTHSVE